MRKNIVSKEHGAKNQLSPDVDKITKDEHLDSSKKKFFEVVSNLLTNNKSK